MPPTEREEISANHTSDKDLISRMYNKLIQFNNQKTNNPVLKYAKDIFEWTFLRRRHNQQSHGKTLNIISH